MASTIRVECIYAGPGILEREAVSLTPPATVGDALAASRLEPRLTAAGHPVAGYAVFARRVTESDPVHDGDRVEILRPLVVTPTEARRLRAAAKQRRNRTRDRAD